MIDYRCSLRMLIVGAALVSVSPLYAGSGALALPKAIDKVAFGACAPQMEATPIFDTIRASEPDLFIMAGDLIYPDVNDEGTGMIEPWPSENLLERVRDVYAQQAAKPEYQRLVSSVPMMAIWDDHDYGVNDGHAGFDRKDATRDLFLEFIGESKEGERWRTSGAYDARIVGPKGRRVQVILMDLRYFRSAPQPDPRSKEEKEALNIAGKYAPSDDPDATILGDAQWIWLEKQLSAPAEVRLLVSTFPVVARETGLDAWGNFPIERQRLFNLIRDTGASGVVVLSGDPHFMEISRTDEGPYPIYDFTVGPLCGYKAGNERFANAHRISEAITDYNYGEVQIDWSTKTLFLRGVGVDGETLLKDEISFKTLRASNQGDVTRSLPNPAD